MKITIGVDADVASNVNFILGVATGIVQEFQFGVAWSSYSRSPRPVDLRLEPVAEARASCDALAQAGVCRCWAASCVCSSRRIASCIRLISMSSSISSLAAVFVS